MKRLAINYYMVALLTIISMCLSCKKQNEVTPKVLVTTGRVLTPEYLANLRSYKASRHQVFFGWFGGSGGTGEVTSEENRFDGLPDSMDIISCWGGLPSPGSPQMTAMRFCQQQKGMKALLVQFMGNNLLYGNPQTPDGLVLAAKALDDTLNKYQLDGFDIDNEGSGYVEDNLPLYLQALSKYIGPESGTGKVLIVDGPTTGLNAADVKYIDYCVGQNYGTEDYGTMQNLYDDALSVGVPTDKYIYTAGFGDGGGGPGGGTFNDPVRGTISALLGYAYFEPSQGTGKGGIGGYLFEYDYSNNAYTVLRQAIQIMNPAVQ